MKTMSNIPNTTAPTAERPRGAMKDVSTPGAGDGTPFRQDHYNDIYYAFNTVMNDVGITSDDSDEAFEAGTGSSQFLSALRLFTSQYAYPGVDQGLKNISAGNQTTDITAFEAAGGSEKKDGYTIRIRWTGGDASFNHQITSAYTIGNELTGFIAASNWKGEGAGELVLRLDKTNSKWLVLSPGIWDSGSNSDGTWRKHVDGSLTQNGRGSISPSAENEKAGAITLPVATKNTSYYANGILDDEVGGAPWVITRVISRTTTSFAAVFNDPNTQNRTDTVDFDWAMDDFWP
jgi:hypothetical protein